MTKFVLCIIVGVISLATYNTMAADPDGYHPMCRATQIANEKYDFKRCLDFNVPPYGSNNVEEIRVELGTCTKQRQNQLWILSPEGLIRTLGNMCLVYDPFHGENNKYAKVMECDKAPTDLKRWKVMDGSIIHSYSSQALTASLFLSPYMPAPVLLEKETYDPSQHWKFV